MHQMKVIFKKLSKLFIVLIIYLIMFLIIFFSKELSLGIKNGINISINLLIPSMFIFMVFSNVIIDSKLRYLICRPFSFLAKYILRISQQNLAIVILSLIGGYPIGAKLINQAVSKGNLSKKQAENMLCYCVNCGPAFLISGVGITIFSSFKIGLFLYLSQVIACLATGFILSFFNNNYSSVQKYEQESSSYPKLFVNAVNNSVKSMAIICGFVVAFSALMPILNIMLEYINSEYSYVIQGLLEVTAGCNLLSSIKAGNKILLCALFTGFGGICVHLQVYAMVSQSNIKIYKFLLMRIVYTSISVFVMKFILILSPDTALNCISLSSSIKQDIYSVSPISTVFMILLSVMLLFFSKQSDKI